MCEGALRSPSEVSNPRLRLLKGLWAKTLAKSLNPLNTSEAKFAVFTETWEISRVFVTSCALFLFAFYHGPFQLGTPSHNSYHYLVTENHSLWIWQNLTSFFFFFGLVPHVTTSTFLFFYRSFRYDAGTPESLFKRWIEWFQIWKIGSISPGYGAFKPDVLIDWQKRNEDALRNQEVTSGLDEAVSSPLTWLSCFWSGWWGGEWRAAPLWLPSN